MKCKRLLAIVLAVAAMMSLFVMPTSASADPIRDAIRDEVDWLDHFFTYGTYYMVVRVNKLMTDTNFQEVVVPADKYEAAIRDYFVVTDAQIEEIRNMNSGIARYNAEDRTYTIMNMLGAGREKQREYAGYVKNGNRYDVYYQTKEYTWLSDVYDEEIPLDEYIELYGIENEFGYKSKVEYKGVVYTNREGFCAITLANRGRCYTVEMNGDIVRIVSVKDVDTMPASFDDYFFKDVKEGTWYYDAVKFMSDKNYMNGYANGLFGPANHIQRQDFVVMLARMRHADLDAYAGQNGGLSDVPAKSYYSAAVAWAVDNGIITGYQSGKFGVGDVVNREQVATILYRYRNSPAVENAEETLAAYPDAAKVSAFARDAMAWAVQEGIISGTQSGKLSPAGAASRAQVAVIIHRMMTA